MRPTLVLVTLLSATQLAWADDPPPPVELEAPENRGTSEAASAAIDTPPADAPPAPAVPAAATPSVAAQPKPSAASAFGASTPEDLVNRVMPGGFRVLLHGYFRAPLRLAFADRGANRKDGEAQYNIRTPWLVDDDYFHSGFAYTRLAEQDWSELYLGVGNKWLSAELALMGSLYSDWARPLIDHQWGIAQGFVTFHWDKEGPRLKFRIQVRGGAFWDRFGYLEKYDTYLFGRTHQLGAQLRMEFSTPRVTVFLQQGVGAHLEAIDANQGLTLLNYVVLGARYKRLAEAGFYFLDSTEQDKRQLNQLTDANMRIYGLDARVNTLRFGRFYVGGSVITAQASTFLSPVLEVLHSFGGRGLTENFFGTDKSENGTGRLYNLGFEHRYSLADLLRRSGPSRLHALRGGDVTMSWFGLVTYALSKQADPDPAVNKNGRTYFKWGAELAWQALSWLGASLRYDRVILDTNDDANSFRIITPRITLRTHWLLDAELFLQYSRYSYGARVQLRPGQVPLETQPDTDVLKIQAQISF